jgi:type I restriction enzyme, S subunit
MKNGWPTATLGDLCERITKGSSPKWQGFKYVDMPGILFVTSENVRENEMLFDRPKYVEDAFNEKDTRSTLKRGDVLTNLVGASIGRTAVFDRDEVANINQAVGILRCKPDLLNNRFLAFLLNSPVFTEILHDSEVNNARANLSLTFFKNLEIPLPPLSEQRRIVGILDEAFEGIATAKANAEKNLQNARALFESHLNAVFTQRGDGWTDTTLGETCENLDSKRVPITKSKRVAGEYAYYGASGIVDYVNNYIFDEDLLLVSEDGANLLARTYPIAFSVSGKVWVNNHAHVLRFPDKASQRFMEFYLNSIKLDTYVSGMAQPKLNQKSLNSIPVPSPPLVQQKAIVANLDSLQDETQRLESIYQRKLAALDELKKSLLHQAFSGAL